MLTHTSLFQLSAVGYESQPYGYPLTQKDLMLYALGVGASLQDKHGMKFLFEGSPEFSALPTFGVIPAFGAFAGLLGSGLPGLTIDLSRVNKQNSLCEGKKEISLIFILISDRSCTVSNTLSCWLLSRRTRQT